MVNASPDELTTRLLARALSAPIDDGESLAAATTGIVELGIADSVAILERDGDTLTSRAVTDELAGVADRLQRELREGPCVQAAYVNDLVVSADVAVDERWPRWGAAAVDVGIRSVISVQLYSSDRTMGALNLFFRERHEFPAEDLETARTVAIPISIELAHLRKDEHLWKAIDARHRIGQAQGILMERFKIDDTAAFAVLRRISQHQNTKLAIVADTLVRTRELPASEEGSVAG